MTSRPTPALRAPLRLAALARPALARPALGLLAVGLLTPGCPTEPVVEPTPDAFRARRDAGPDTNEPLDADVDADLDAPIGDDALTEDAPDLDAFDPGEPDAGMDGGPPPCSASSECLARDPAHPVCEGFSGECVECSVVERGACEADEFCDIDRCATGCSIDDDCSAPTPRCRTSDHLCVACLDDDDCALGTLCDTGASRCVPGCTFDHACPGATEDCCSGACLDVSADPANCGACGVSCSGLCRGSTCTYLRSCTALLAADPTLASGSYDVDVDGDGFPERVYCDMTTAGGGWTLAARITVSDGRAHVDRNAVGVLDTPTQTTTAKLSDAQIDALRGDIGTSVLRLDCGAGRAYFQAGARLFDGAGFDNVITRCSSSPSGPWEDGPSGLASSEVGVSSLVAGTCDTVAFAESASDGCFDGTSLRSGALWVRSGTVAALTGCAALLAADPLTPSGVHDIDPDGPGPRGTVRAYCDMTTGGGGWTYGLIVGTSTDTDGYQRVAGYSSFGTAGPPTAGTEYGIDLGGMRFQEIRIDNFSLPASVDARARAVLTWGGTEYRSVSTRPAMRVWTGGAFDLRSGYFAFDPACMPAATAIPVCLADTLSPYALVCDTDLSAAQGMLDCQGGEHCGMPVAARAWADTSCTSYATGTPGLYGLAVR